MKSISATKEFYTQDEASRLLQVTKRTLYNYRKEGRLRVIKHGNNVLYYRKDVDQIYYRRNELQGDVTPDHRTLNERLKKVEKTLEVIKLGLGFGKPRDPLTTSELLLLFHSVMDKLGKPGWTVLEISAFADEMMSLREEDLKQLSQIKGPNAWAPMFDLLQRMILFVEEMSDFPDAGLGTLHSRLLRARDRTYGVLHASRIVSYTSGPDIEPLVELEGRPRICSITAYIIEYAAFRVAEHQT